MTESTHTLMDAIDRFAKAKLLCVGDVMLDKFIYGHVERISPEAPIPVMRQEKAMHMLGGAGNVARNIASLGAEVTFLSVVGEDKAGQTISELCQEHDRVHEDLLKEKERKSTEKSRFIAAGQQMFRLDHEVKQPLGKASQEQLIDKVAALLPGQDRLILSDYGKGVLDKTTVRKLIETAKSMNKPVVIDPKSLDWSDYSGAWLVTPNLKELQMASRSEVHTLEEIEKTARQYMQTHQIANMIITCGPRGMIVIPEQGEALHIKARKREVFDVSGAGDTVLATLATALSSGCDLTEAATLANIAAGIVVSRQGTATVYRTDLKAAVHTQDLLHGQRKIFPLDVAVSQVESWHHDRLKVGFTNGCFDIIHAGHVQMINDAKTECDRLIVALNSDDSVRRLKGSERPVNKEIDRAMLLAELQSVDMVVIFREDTPEETLKRLRPDVLMKGEDYQIHEIVGADLVQSYGGEVKRIPLKEGYSTTGTIEKLRNVK